MNRQKRLVAAILGGLLAIATGGPGAIAADPLVGNLVDFTGRTAQVGTPYGQAKIDAAAWVNAHGGANGKKIDIRTFDY